MYLNNEGESTPNKGGDFPYFWRTIKYKKAK